MRRKRTKTRGMLITFEGPEGSGKSTHIASLGRRLKKLGYKVLLSREPGGTATGEAIRNILQHDAAHEQLSPECELLLFEASRAQLVRNIILPALASDTIVICDRYTDSTLAYQGYGRGMNRNVIDTLNSFAVGAAVPDLTILLDIDVTNGFKRLITAKQRKDRIESAGRAFHNRVRKGFLKIAASAPRRVVTIDARGPFDEVEQNIWNTVGRHIRDSV